MHDCARLIPFLMLWFHARLCQALYTVLRKFVDHRIPNEFRMVLACPPTFLYNYLYHFKINYPSIDQTIYLLSIPYTCLPTCLSVYLFLSSPSIADMRGWLRQPSDIERKGVAICRPLRDLVTKVCLPWGTHRVLGWSQFSSLSTL